jgi:hypothetical protein
VVGAYRDPFGFTTDSEQQNLLALVISNYMAPDDDEGHALHHPEHEGGAANGDDDDDDDGLDTAAFSIRMSSASAAEFSGGVGVVYAEKKVAGAKKGKGKARRLP